MSVRWAHLGWYVGIKKNGKAKRGSKTGYPPNQKAILFVTRKQSAVQPFPDSFDFEDESSTRVRRAVGTETGNYKNSADADDFNAPKNKQSAAFPSEGANQSPIMFIDDEAGIVNVTKTTTVNRVLHDLSREPEDASNRQ